MQNLCFKESARPFVSAKTKKRCQLKCCNFNLSINIVYKRTKCLYFVYFNMAARQKLSCRHLAGPSLSRPTLSCFGLVWSNHLAGKMYPEMDIRRIVQGPPTTSVLCASLSLLLSEQLNRPLSRKNKKVC